MQSNPAGQDGPDVLHSLFSLAGQTAVVTGGGGVLLASVTAACMGVVACTGASVVSGLVSLRSPAGSGLDSGFLTGSATFGASTRRFTSGGRTLEGEVNGGEFGRARATALAASGASTVSGFGSGFGWSGSRGDAAAGCFGRGASEALTASAAASGRVTGVATAWLA